MLTAIPLLNLLNYCCCLLIDLGVIAGLAMYLKSNPNDKMTAGEAAAFGAMTGGIAGLVGGILGWIVGMIFSSIMAGLLSALAGSVPPEVLTALGQQGAMGLLSVPIYAILGAGMGALFGFLGLILFFKERKLG